MNLSLLANAGVPMIFLALPPMVFLLIPVVLIEAMFAKGAFKTEKKKTVWLGIIGANVGSTFIGWPIAWLCLVGIELLTGGGGGFGISSPLEVIMTLTLGAAWLVPYESDLYWLIPSAMAFLLIPFFFVSVYAERFILKKIWKNEEKTRLIKFSWKSHFASYAFLMAVVIGFGIYSIKDQTDNQSVDTTPISAPR